MVRVIVANEKINCEKLLGEFVDGNHYDVLIQEDTDCYMPPDCDISVKIDCEVERKDCSTCDSGVDEKRIAFKFRKNFFSKHEQELAYKGLREAARSSQNRGLAAGPKGEKCGGREWVTDYQYKILNEFAKINSLEFASLESIVDAYKKKYNKEESTRGLVWLSAEVKKQDFFFDKWLQKVINIKEAEQINQQANWVLDTFISDTTYANAVHSGIAGWFDRYPRIPYGRATNYTENNYEKFEMSFPFLQSLNSGFKNLLPERWGNQKAAADKVDPEFLVPGTVFSTITVNKTFRTACHRDAGDFSDGLSNLLVLSNDGNYTGGYLVFPEYRIAVDVRPGDLLLVNNHEIIHGNTPIVLGSENSERISLVCYLREGMLELGSREYEEMRYQFIESRRKNKEHPEYRNKWNGISENCFSDSANPKQNWENALEWYNYLNNNNGRKYLEKHHPWLIERFEINSGVYDLFG